MDREEFFRLKKIQSKKKRDTAVKEQEDKLKREKEEAEYEAKYAETGEREKKQDEEVGMDLLQEKDEDGASAFPSVL
jgi:V-type H+-transporting ATPase subunit D